MLLPVKLEKLRLSRLSKFHCKLLPCAIKNDYYSLLLLRSTACSISDLISHPRPTLSLMFNHSQLAAFSSSSSSSSTHTKPLFCSLSFHSELSSIFKATREGSECMRKKSKDAQDERENNNKERKRGSFMACQDAAAPSYLRQVCERRKKRFYCQLVSVCVCRSGKKRR